MSSSAHVQSPLLNVSRPPAKHSLGWSILAVLIGALFIYAGALKVWRPLVFANDIAHFHILSWPVGIRLAFYLPWLEMFCGLALIVGRLRLGALAILSVLTAIFICATISARMRGIDITCGCFGSAGRGISLSWHLILDVAILAGLLALCFSPLAARAVQNPEIR
ncbi:MAG: MauE/DoxX family redox-associated membrane protein [Chthoniobacterales bacterium]